MTHSHDEPHEIEYSSAGTRLHAVERGRGYPVVFLHGGLADHRASVFSIGALAASHRLITPDLRGAGRSIYAGALTWDMLADDLVALLDHLGLGQAVIGGSSAGSGVALRFGLRHPQRALAVVLVSPVYAGPPRGLTPAQRAAFDRMHEVGQRVVAEGIEALVPLFDALPLTIRARAVAMARQFDPASVAATTRFLASGVPPFEALADLERLSVPTVVVPGTDPEHPAEIAALYGRAIPDATLLNPGAAVAHDVAEALRALVGTPPR